MKYLIGIITVVCIILGAPLAGAASAAMPADQRGRALVRQALWVDGSRQSLEHQFGTATVEQHDVTVGRRIVVVRYTIRTASTFTRARVHFSGKTDYGYRVIFNRTILFL